jgi:nickel-dependent lactate racemase
MPKFTFHYGKTIIGFELSENFESTTILPAEVFPSKPEIDIVNTALSSPLRNLEIEKLFSSTTTVAIVVNDKTRPVPNQILIPPLLERLLAYGIAKENIQFIIGMGTHIPMVGDEFIKVLPESIVREYIVTAHNCDNKENLVYKGITSRGTPVYVNKQFEEADIRIVIGNIEPHHFAGFSGGVKSASIGVCGRETINKNHAHLLEKGSIVGNYENNPLRQDIEEIGRMIEVDLALNVVMNVEKQILEAFWGNPEDVMEQGIKASRQISMRSIPEPVDLVIASAGGYPKDINLYQAQKAMTHSSLILKPGGVILLAAACEEGIGSQSYEKFMDGITTIESVFDKFNNEGFSVGPHKAVQIARIAQEHPIILLSTIPEKTVSKLLLHPVKSIEDGIKLANELRPIIKKIAILPFAVSTIPFIERPGEKNDGTKNFSTC